MNLILLIFINFIISKEISIGFGSCYKSNKKLKTDILKEVIKNKPSYFFFIGDLFYLDKIIFLTTFKPDYKKMREIIDSTTNDKNYIELNKQSKVKAIWDDHDYGLNNSDKMFQDKHEMRKIFLDFLGEDKNSPRYNQKGGIYTHYYISNRVKVILLDNRFSKDPID